MVYPMFIKGISSAYTKLILLNRADQRNDAAFETRDSQANSARGNTVNTLFIKHTTIYFS